MDSDVKRAMEEAKQLEAHSPDSLKDIQKIYKDGMGEADSLRSLLQPTWFVGASKKRKKSPVERKVYKPGRASKTRR